MSAFEFLARRGAALPGFMAVATALAFLASCATPGVDTSPAVGTASGSLPSIAVQAPIGLPPDKAQRLGDQLIRAFQQRGISMAANPTSAARFKLQGVCSAADGGQSTSVACVWDALGAGGARAQRIVTEETVAGSSPADPWASVGGTTLDAIAVSVADKVAAWLPSAPAGGAGGGGSLFSLPSIPGLGSGSSTAVALVGVSGAPGDGNEALARAMATALRGRNIPVTGASSRSYRLAGTVSVVGAGADEQSVTIEWTLTDPQGASLGTITQKNRVPRGALDGAWGATADGSAAAAARGVAELLPPSN